MAYHAGALSLDTYISRQVTHVVKPNYFRVKVKHHQALVSNKVPFVSLHNSSDFFNTAIVCVCLWSYFWKLRPSPVPFIDFGWYVCFISEKILFSPVSLADPYCSWLHSPVSPCSHFFVLWKWKKRPRGRKKKNPTCPTPSLNQPLTTSDQFSPHLFSPSQLSRNTVKHAPPHTHTHNSLFH